MTMRTLGISAGLGFAIALAAVYASATDTRKEAHMDIAPGGAITIVNNSGAVNLKSGGGNQVVLVYTIHSDKVEVDQTSTPDKRRIEFITHALPDQKPTTEESRVDYEVTVPAGVSVTVSTSTAPIAADSLRGDLTLSSDTGQVTVRNLVKSQLRIRGVNAPVNLSDVTGGTVEITANGGPIQMVNVTGRKVNVGTSSGNISYKGDCSGGGDYSFTSHTGSIDMALPEAASVDLTARSVNGTVENDFPLQKKSHTSFVPKAGSSFAGTSNSGSSSVELQSFSGRIRVKKQ